MEDQNARLIPISNHDEYSAPGNCIYFIIIPAPAQNAGAILGIWPNEEKDARIEVYNSGKYFGKMLG